ncbi:hypothetical protein [Streptomyces sp. NPDC006510]|uniref:hypothetical protein n=1 Tax=Streptomyces sp. NPDC006510 TaxID=3155600 RepID=UPI0033A8C19A
MSGTQRDWEQLHTDVYGRLAYSQGLISCGALVAHHCGYDRREMRGPGGPRPERPDAPDAREFDREWMPVVAVMALAACRAAWQDGVLVDDVELPLVLGWVDGVHTHRLADGPLDSDREAGDWRRLAEDTRSRRRAREVVSAAVAQAITECRDLTGVWDSTPAGALALGTAVRRVRAAGNPDLEPEWAGDFRWATEQVERLHLAVQAGLWQPTPAHQEYARAVHLTLVAEPDHPPLPDGADGPMWIQRIVRIPHVQATVLTLTAQPSNAVLGPVSDPLGAAVNAVAHVGLDSVAALAADLERAWAARPPGQSITNWEHGHLPRPVRDQIRAIEELSLRLTTTLLELLESRA